MINIEPMIIILQDMLQGKLFMDNDGKIVKIVKKEYKRMRYAWNYRNTNILSAQEGNELIAKIIEASKPAMIARCGAVEMRCIGEYLKGGHFSEKVKTAMLYQAGFFPTEEIYLKQFCKLYIDAVGYTDLLPLWIGGAEHKVIGKVCQSTIFTEMLSLEPYFFDDPWSRFLKDKRVLVVHPFADTIRRQYEKRDLLFVNKEVLPQFRKLYCVKAVQSSAGEKTEYITWFEALEYMKSEIAKHDYDVAIIGAGAYGLPLAEYVKRRGKISIQMAGATQILFGIRGKRWDNIPFFAKIYNEHWVYPSVVETPANSDLVEGGSYWR